MPTRRALLRAWLVLPASLVLAACSSAPAPSPPPPAAATATQPVATTPAAAPTTQPTAAPPATTAPAVAAATPAVAQALPPTPACDDDDDELTPAQTEGPYFTRNSPERASLLEPGLAGTRLIVSGWVLATDCQPINRALIDFWQADDRGEYDNAGYRLRGHQFTDQAGQYRLETIVPGLYPGRTRHIHVKVQAPNRPVLTTQLYFPGEPRNAADGIFHQALVLAVQEAADGKLATFNFVLDLG